VDGQRVAEASVKCQLVDRSRARRGFDETAESE
jgi:hypothetical protein